MNTRVHSSTIHNHQKVETARHAPIDKQMNTMWFVDAMDYYSP